jgi:L-asparaginase/Glu-tRNA(Gln) amidotransferase subunit D
VTDGRVLPNHGFDGGGKTLGCRAVMGDDLSPQKARILLVLLLQNGVQGQKAILRNKRNAGWLRINGGKGKPAPTGLAL